MEGFLVLLLCAVVFLAVTTLFQSVKIVQQYERAILMRFGKYSGDYNPGLAFILPFVDRLIRVDMREQVINVPPQHVITKDNVTVAVDAVIYYKVTDPVKAEFEVKNFDLACTTLAQTNLRNLIGEMSLDESLTFREKINTSLRVVMDEATNSWGVKVTRVEVQKIDPPVDITEAMSRQMKAERNKRASILEAEGIRQSEILQAEGSKQASILKAEGDAEARVKRAQAEAEATKLVSEAAQAYFKDRAEAKMRLEVTEHSLRGNTKFVIPSDSKLVNIINDTDSHIVPLDEETTR